MNPRDIKDGPFCWQSKATLRKIREASDSLPWLDQALSVYLVLTELASNEQSPTFKESKRTISARSGVCVRRVADALALFKSIGVISWVQNTIEGSKELSENTYTLMSCTPCTTSGTGCIRLGKNAKREICRDKEQSPEESLEQSKNNNTPALSKSQAKFKTRPIQIS